MFTHSTHKAQGAPRAYGQNRARGGHPARKPAKQVFKNPAFLAGNGYVPESQKTKSDESPEGPIGAADRVRVIPLGGVEEVGRNMTIIEYRGDIVIIDAGLQFPEEETPGIDYIIPNTKYLEKRQGRIQGLIISHGHLDHVGAIPYLIKTIGNPTIYSTELTNYMIRKRQDEFPGGHEMLDIKDVKPGMHLKLGKYMTARFFATAHTIPDSIGVIIETPVGNIIYPGDFRIDHDAQGNFFGIDEYEKLGKENNLLLLLESTNAEKEGTSVSEELARTNIAKILAEAKGRVIIGTFSSLLERVIDIIRVAEEMGKKVVVDGYSLKSNIAILQELGVFKTQKKDTIIPAERISDYPMNKIVAVCTGAQGEENAVLMRIANKKHKSIRIHSGDTIILSSSVIPGNERSVQTLKDNLSRQGARVIHSGIMDVHASGHANQEELKMMVRMLKPKFMVPIHGNYFMLKTNSMLAEAAGVKSGNVIVPPANGVIIEATPEKIELLKESVPANYVMVDGLGVGDVKEIVLRDRQLMAQEGMFTIVIIIDRRTRKVIGNPQVTSRGFIVVKENFDLVNTSKKVVEKVVADSTAPGMNIDRDYLQERIREKVAEFLFKKTERRPMVLPVVIEV